VQEGDVAYAEFTPLRKMMYEICEHLCSFWPKRSMPEKGAKVIGLQKDSALSLEAEFGGNTRDTAR
jgi:S-adenosylmethionine synthetase